MTDAVRPYILVPEVALLESLPPHHQRRFEKALYLMHDFLEERLSWEQIAEKSAISPFHFHRQFSGLFGETPGQYLSRVRLQYAVFLLYSHGEHKVTDIAHQCGYSSSQAMAKVLKRELGLKAKDIRTLFTSGTPSETAQLMEVLSHSGEQGSQEQQLAQSIPTELLWYPARGIKVIPIPNFDWDMVFDTYGKESTKLVSATPVMELDKKWEDISYTVGDWKVGVEQYDFFIPEGYYLCCEVYLTTDIAYIAAIDSLFMQAKDQNLSVDWSGQLVELVRDVELNIIGGATFSFQIPILV
ncbi:AraC family transcriptional regulator [Pseudomonas sp. HK3]